MAGKWRGKGGQTHKQLELQLRERANHLFEGLMNLKTGAATLENSWRDVMALRAKVAKAHGVPEAGGGNAEVNWKEEFYLEFQRKHKTVLTKEDCAWEVQETTPVEGERAGYICVLSCSGLESSYQGEEPSVSKKLAENMAAKAAIKSEFKEGFARLSRGGGQQGKGGEKRKAEDLRDRNNNAKQKLLIANQRLCDGEIQKGDILYECVEEGGQYIGTVTLQTYNPSVGYQGLPAATYEKCREQAAEAALTALATEISAAQEIHEANKKAKVTESMNAIREKRDANKAAKA